MRYGLYDTVDNLWLGDEDGPRSFGVGDVLTVAQDGGQVTRRIETDDEALLVARCAAEAACYAVEWDEARIRVGPLPEIPGGAWRKRDGIDKTRTEAEWLVRKERGTIM